MCRFVKNSFILKVSCNLVLLGVVKIFLVLHFFNITQREFIQLQKAFSNVQYVCHRNLRSCGSMSQKRQIEKKINVMLQNSISLVYKILEVIAGLLFDNI